MAPIVDGLEQKYGEQMAVQRLDANTADGQAVMRAYRILGHPTLLLFDRSGQEVERFIGPQTVETIETALQELLAPATK